MLDGAQRFGHLIDGDRGLALLPHDGHRITDLRIKVVTLGNFSTKFILKTDVGITRLHGTLQRAGRFKVFPIFHPAAALYDSKKREALENDFATLGELLRGEA